MNVELLTDVARRAAAASFALPGCEVSLREAIYWFLACAVDGQVTVTWRADRTAVRFGRPGRRYSGYGPWASAPPLPGTERLAALVESGVPSFFVGRSLFAMPRLLRHLARAGLCGVDLDQENSHPRAQLRRHPGAVALGRYVREREAVLEEVRTATGQSRAAAKKLFLQLLYAGGTASWCDAHGVDEAVLPAFVHEFKAEQTGLRLVDCAREEELTRCARAAGHARPDVLVTSVLNCTAERASLDLMEACVGPEGTVASYEHDGLYVTCRTRADCASVTARVQGAADVPVEAKTVPSPADAWTALHAAYPSQAWDVVDEGWRVQLDAVRAARRPSACGRADVLYARIVAAEAEPYPGVPWSTRQLFVHTEKGSYAYYDVARQAWRPPGDAGRNALLHVIGAVLARCCGDYEEGETPEGVPGAWARARRTPPDAVYGYAPLLERVEKLLRCLLTDPSFELDGEDTRRWLAFDNTVFDAAALCFVPRSPAIRATLSTDWEWRGHGLDEATEWELEAALSAWQAAEGGKDEELCAHAAERLAALQNRVADLGFVRSLFGDWDTTMYALKHCARAAFALPMQEFVCAQSPGAGGKDTLCNRMHRLLGRYAANLPFEALSAARDMDAPSQTILGLRGKRFVCVREVGASAKLRGHVVKTLADGVGGWIKARGLWGRDVSFLPHFLLFVSSNVVIEYDEASGPGLARRKKLLRFPWMWVDAPRLANEKKKAPDIEAAFAERNGSFFHLLMVIYKLFLRGGGHTIAPVPTDVDEATQAELREPWMAELDIFVRDRLRPAQRPAAAASAAQVREAFAAMSRNVDKKDAALRLAARGFAEGTTHTQAGGHRTTRRTYSYAFPGATDAALVQLLPLGVSPSRSGGDETNSTGG